MSCLCPSCHRRCGSKSVDVHLRCACCERQWLSSKSIEGIISLLLLTYKSNVDVLEAGVGRCSYRDISFNGIHCGVRCNPGVAWPIVATQVDFNVWLAIVRHVAHLVSDLVSHRLHCAGVRVNRRSCRRKHHSDGVRSWIMASSTNKENPNGLHRVVENSASQFTRECGGSLEAEQSGK
jgi:hypothetical protein